MEGLGRSSGEALWLDRAAAARQVAEARAAGLEVGEGDAVISLSPGAVATSAALRAFLAAAAGRSGDLVGRLTGPAAAWGENPAFGPPPRIFRMTGGGEWSPEREARAAVISLDFPARSVPMRLARREGEAAEIPWSEAGLWSTHTWLGVLWANLLSLGPFLVEITLGPPLWRPLRLLWAALRARSTRPEVVAGRLNRLGKGAWIHPSAVVEGCLLGAGAQVDAGAVVRGSILGEGARVEPHALVAGAVLGEGTVVQRHGWAMFSVLHAGSSHGGAMQLGVLGPHAAVKGGAYLLDQNLNKDVRVSREGLLYPAPLGVAGVAVGAGATVASGVWVAPGRALSPNSVALPNPSLLYRPEQAC